LIDVMLLGHWIEKKSVKGASDTIAGLGRLLPAEAHLLSDAKVIDVPIESLKLGDLVLVRSGERVPSDGTVIKGESHVDESLPTGESSPVKKSRGDRVIGGS